MIKGAVFTIGILALLGGAGFGLLTIMGAAMSDNVQASQSAMSDATPCFVVAGIGIAAIVGAFFIP